MFRTNNKLKSCENVFENKGYCAFVMRSEEYKILELNWYKKTEKKPSTIYTGIKPLIKKLDGCNNNPEKSSATKVGGHIP